jgi:hypothetical protein
LVLWNLEGFTGGSKGGREIKKVALERMWFWYFELELDVNREL